MIIVSLIPSSDKLGKMIDIIGSKQFPALIKSVRKASNFALKEWKKAVENSNAKDGWKEEYKNDIRIQATENSLKTEIVSDSMYSNFVENGITRYDMKPGLLKGRSHRVIFFQKGIPSAMHLSPMPESLYERVKSMGFNESLTGIGTFGMTKSQVATMKRNKWKSGLYEGITKLNRQGHTQYGTFRVVSKKSTGWIYPGAAAVPIFDNFVTRVTPKIKEMMQKGLIEDLQQGIK